MKGLIIIFLLFFTLIGIRAQNNIEEVLKNIESNNKALKANNQLTQSKKLEASVGNTLPDPNIAYDHLWSSPKTLGTSRELTISQGFDFPTVYTNRNKLVKLKSSLYDQQDWELRQTILLDAKLVCIDIIALNRLLEYQNIRLQNARQLSELYKKRVSEGDANILESNRIDMELLNIQTESRRTKSALETKRKELQSFNGGIPISLNGTTYTPVTLPTDFDTWKVEALTADASLIALEKEKEIAQREIKLNQSQWLPKFELGYKREAGEDVSNGITFGVSIPLYENKNKIKQAKAMSLYTDMQIESSRMINETTLQGIYTQAISLEKSKQDYERLLNSQNTLDLLKKALNEGQISLSEYFVEAIQVYQTIENYIQLESEYQKLVAQLYKYRL
ncbi:TolC family protein [Coprobacter secundus]|jgi:hypothetical protein|uniref:TolC family protein n=1 Tax=Coprobacter secundus TaxID=1501392 RepID=UPI000573C0E6|nr:TolC family protein [Coprobacter secundus]KHM48689.1 transporter [Coprobacter secundus]